MFEGSGSGQVSPGVMIAVVVALAGLDLAGAILAKEWTGGATTWLLVAGAMSFLLLFGVYALSLRYAELSTVTFGWIVTLQVGVLLVERVRYGVDLSAGKWLAIVAIMVLQAYLVLVPARDAPPARDPVPTMTAVVAEAP